MHAILVHQPVVPGVLAERIEESEVLNARVRQSDEQHLQHVSEVAPPHHVVRVLKFENGVSREENGVLYGGSGEVEGGGEWIAVSVSHVGMREYRLGRYVCCSS